MAHSSRTSSSFGFIALLISTVLLPSAEAWNVLFTDVGHKCSGTLSSFTQYGNSQPSGCQIIGNLGNHCYTGGYSGASECASNFAYHPALMSADPLTVCTVFTDTACSKVLARYPTNGGCFDFSKLNSTGKPTSFVCYSQEPPPSPPPTGGSAPLPPPTPTPTPPSPSTPWFIQFYYGGRAACRSTEFINYHGTTPSTCQVIGKSGYGCSDGAIPGAPRCGNTPKPGPKFIFTDQRTKCKLYEDGVCGKELGDFGDPSGACYGLRVYPGEPAVGSFRCRVV